MSSWEGIFRKKGRVFLEPFEGMQNVISFLRESKAERVLDLGCGTGRHTIMLSRVGFKSSAFDISSSGISQTRRWLKEEGLKADVRKASCCKRFPYDDGYFDAVISTQVIHHNVLPRVRYCIREISRVLRKGGVIYITVPATKSRRCGKIVANRMIAPNTYMPTEGDEKGLPHYIFTESTMRKEFKDYEILSLEMDKSWYYRMLARKK